MLLLRLFSSELLNPSLFRPSAWELLVAPRHSKHCLDHSEIQSSSHQNLSLMQFEKYLKSNLVSLQYEKGHKSSVNQEIYFLLQSQFAIQGYYGILFFHRLKIHGELNLTF